MRRGTSSASDYRIGPRLRRSPRHPDDELLRPNLVQQLAVRPAQLQDHRNHAQGMSGAAEAGVTDEKGGHELTVTEA